LHYSGPLHTDFRQKFEASKPFYEFKEGLPFNSAFGGNGFHMNLLDVRNRGEDLAAKGKVHHETRDPCKSSKENYQLVGHINRVSCPPACLPDQQSCPACCSMPARPRSASPVILSMPRNQLPLSSVTPHQRPRPLSSPGLRRPHTSESPLWNGQVPASRSRPQSSPGVRSDGEVSLSRLTLQPDLIDALKQRMPHAKENGQGKVRAEAAERHHTVSPGPEHLRRLHQAAMHQVQGPGAAAPAQRSPEACKRSSSEPGIRKTPDTKHWFNKPGVNSRVAKPDSSKGFRTASYADHQKLARW